MSLLRQLQREGLLASLWILYWWRGVMPWRKRRHLKRCRQREERLQSHPETEWRPSQAERNWYSPQFYLQPEEQQQVVQELRESDPAECAALHEQCEAICAGDLSWLMEGAGTLGHPPDWLALLDRPGRWPLVPSKQIDYGSEARPGDIRRIWELNRLQHLVRLAQGRRVLGEARYGQVLAQQLRDWLEHNPFGLGPNWTQAQEVALRAVSWCWIWHLAHDLPELDAKLRKDLLLAMARSLRFLDEHVAVFGRHTHNHLISELAGLQLLCRFFPFLPEASRLEAWSRSRLDHEIRKQIYPDGLAGELASNYMLFVLDSLVGSLAANREFWRTRDAWQRVAAMGEASSRITRPDGSLPFFGDNDSGRGWLLSAELQRRECYAQLPALMQGQAVPEWTPRQPAAEWRWLFGPGLSVPETAPRPASRLFREGGIWSWRSSSGADASWLLLRGGATSRRRGVMQSHHHADMLSFELVWKGHPVIVDPGSYAYSLETELRQLFRSSRVHAGLWVEGREGVDFRNQRFGVWQLPDSVLEQVEEHSITMSCQWRDVLHRRRIQVEPERVVLEDHVQRPAERDAGLGLPLAAGLEAESRHSGWYLPQIDLSIRLDQGEGCRLSMEQAMLSQRYAHKQPAQRLRVLLPQQPFCELRIVIEEGDTA